ncbi:hypothetical protein KUTeg_015162 [Tegillarca granosa]|uniref:Uncharacterized protein n=1 Tax=Tegillarca granosa TaxID=220873 RepID=A0ABQ9EUU6_TEGGR|nr:hypothetical protein KUTeg_015162 [Tegillarca granosa]
MSDVFNAPVYITDVANSASLGGCYRAKHGLSGQKFEEVVKGHPEPVCVATPTPGAEQTYVKDMKIHKNSRTILMQVENL